MDFRSLPLLLALAAASAAQSAHFESGVTNIHVDAIVTQENRVVTGLQARDFVVRDEGEQQEVVAFGEESVPLDLVLMLDLGGT